MSESVDDVTAGEEVFTGDTTAVEKQTVQQTPVIQEDLANAIKRVNEGAKLTPEMMTFEAVFKLIATQHAMIEKQQKDFEQLMTAHNNLVEHFNKLPKNQVFILAVAGEVANFLEAKINDADNEVEEKVSNSLIPGILYDASCPDDRKWETVTQLTFTYINEEKTSIALIVREWSEQEHQWVAVEKPSDEKAPYYRACLKVMQNDNLPENVPYYFWYEKKPDADLVPTQDGNTAVASKVSREENIEGVKFSYELDDRGIILSYDAFATIDGVWEEIEMSKDVAEQYRTIVEEAGGKEGEVWYIEMTLENIGPEVQSGTETVADIG